MQKEVKKWGFIGQQMESREEWEIDKINSNFVGKWKEEKFDNAG